MNLLPEFNQRMCFYDFYKKKKQLLVATKKLISFVHMTIYFPHRNKKKRTSFLSPIFLIPFHLADQVRPRLCYANQLIKFITRPQKAHDNLYCFPNTTTEGYFISHCLN